MHKFNVYTDTYEEGLMNRGSKVVYKGNKIETYQIDKKWYYLINEKIITRKENRSSSVCLIKAITHINTLEV